MKKLTLAVSLILATLGITYGQSAPSQKEIEKMKKQAQAEMDKLKKDPQYKDMMEQVEKMHQPATPPKKTSPKAQDAKLAKLAPGQIPTPAQAKDRLLWYKGKKLNDSMIVTTKGQVVKYSRRSQQLTVQPPPKNPFARMTAEVNQTEKRKDEFIEMMAKSKNGYFIYPFVREGLEAIEDVDKKVAPILTSKIDLPSTPAPPPTSNKTGKGGDLTDETEIPNWIIADHAAVVSFTRAHEKDKSVDVPEPPARDFDYCEICDSTKRKEADKRDSLYMVQFSKESSEVMEKAIAIERYCELLHAPAEYDAIRADCDSGIKVIFNYQLLQCDALMDKYSKDFERLSIVARIVLSIERQRMLMGVSDETGSGDRFLRIVNAMDGADNYIDKLIKEEDYRQLLNYRWIVGIARAKALLGSDGDLQWLGPIMEKLDRFNRFRLTIDARSKMVIERDEKGQVTHTVDARLKGEEYYTIIPDETCDLRLMNTKRSQFTGEGMNGAQAMEATQFKMTTVEAKSTKATYVEPAEWITITPFARMNFCRLADTIVVYAFGPKMGTVEKWNFPKDGVQHASYVFEAMSSGFPTHDIEREVSADMDENQIMKSLTTNFSDNPTLHDMQFKNRVMLLESKAFSAQHTGGIYLIGGFSNKNTRVFDAEVDGKDGNDNPDILSARLKVILEHAPEH